MIQPLTSARLRARHGFFTRQGGVSEGIYASLQGGWGAKGDPRANVAENRARIAAWLGTAPTHLISNYQVHSAVTTIIDAPPAPADPCEADGLATRTPGLALAALSADCAPVLLEDAEAGVVAACHAGWKGALDGIVEATVAAMVQQGADPARIAAVIGPCISQESYEVGPEYVARFTAADADNARFFADGPDPAARAEGRAQFDLPGYVLSRLVSAGVENAEWIGRCTYAEPDLFFSNRRALHQNEPDYGRLISAIILDPDHNGPRP